MTHYLRALWAKLRGLFGDRRAEPDLDDEIEAHLRLLTERYVRQGMTEDEAALAARRQFGNVTLLKEANREMRGIRFIETFFQDLRYGVRMLRRNPGFTFVTALTLALGIGANTAIFSVVNAVLLRPLPYAEPERLVALWGSDHERPDSRGMISYPNFLDWRAQSQSFERMASYHNNNVTLTGVSTPVNLHGATVTTDLFAVLGVKPQLGRWFLAEEAQPGAHVIVISHSLWQRQFGGDANILGRALTLDGKSFSIVGVMPAGFQFPIEADPVEVWMSAAVDAEKSDPKDTAMTEQRGAHYLNAVARLKPGVTLVQAQAELNAIAARLERQYPDSNKRLGARVIPYHNDLMWDYSAALWLVLGAVGCVLLIACANVANLLLARATTRHKEMAVRVAVGANRWRVVRQLLTESLLLAVAGGLLGLLLAWWGTGALIKLIPADLPRLAEINLDRWVFGFTFIVSIATGLIFGLAPALKASKVELTDAMKEGARCAGQSGARLRLRGALVVAEIAVAVVALIGAGLLLQTFSRLRQVDLGYDVRNVLTASVELPDARYTKTEQVAAFYQELLRRVQALPGVESASAIAPQPLSGDNFTIPFAVAGRDIPKGDEPSAHFRAISLDYFRTMKIPLLTGRDFTAADTAQAAPVVIINESFAHRHFPNENPLGKKIKPGISIEGPTQWREIVGIVKDVKHRQSLSRDYEPEFYLPHVQMPINSLNLVLRTTVEPRALVSAVAAQVRALDRDLPIYRLKMLEQYLSASVAQPKFTALLLGLFGALALLLTVIGLYGVMAYAVAQRTQEIGVRLALGAQPRNVVLLILRQGVWLTALGLAFGLAATLALTRLMTALLFGVSATDPATFTLVASLLVVVALIASYIPARRATKIDPLQALRHE